MATTEKKAPAKKKTTKISRLKALMRDYGNMKLRL